jgi:hypothetical protein
MNAFDVVSVHLHNSVVLEDVVSLARAVQDLSAERDKYREPEALAKRLDCANKELLKAQQQCNAMRVALGPFTMKACKKDKKWTRKPNRGCTCMICRARVILYKGE